MAAQQIPNLNTLLRGRGGRGRGRGRARGGNASSSEHHGSAPSADAIVQRTDDDAAGSRMSAVDSGYLEDPFARAFYDGGVTRRFPIMNRGQELSNHRRCPALIVAQEHMFVLPQ